MNVYLSSTLQDLLEERAVVREALAGQHVVRESYNAHESDIHESCAQDVRDCDLYIGIVGLRYGFCPNGGEKSVMELEFDAATEANIPRLIFFKGESTITVDATDADTPGGLTRVRAWRARLQTVVRPAIFRSSHELSRLLLRSLSEYDERTRRLDSVASPNQEQESKVFESLQRLLESHRTQEERGSFHVMALHRRVNVHRPHAELELHEELINVSTSPRDERVALFVSDTPIEFKDLGARVLVTIGDDSFPGAVSATQPKRDGRLFKVRVGFKGRTVGAGKTTVLDWQMRFPGSVGLNEDYWVFSCPDERPIRDHVCEVVFPIELADYRFFRIESDGRREPLAMAANVIEDGQQSVTRYVYRAVQRDTAGMYLMTWRLE